MANIEIHDSEVSITVVVDIEELRRVLREELAPIQGAIMSQSSEVHDVAAMVEAFTADALARFDRLQAAIDNPSDASALSAEAQAELGGIRQVLEAARSAAGLGDENADGTPAAEAPPVA